MSRAANSGKKPRVCVLAYHLSPNDARFLKLRETLTKNGFEVSAVAPAIGPLASGVEAVTEGRVSRFFERLRRWAPTARIAGGYLARRRKAALAGRVAQHRPSIILTFDPEALPAAVRASELTGAKLIFDAHEYHSDEAPDQPERGRWVAATERDYGPRLDAFMTVNQSIADLYARDQRIPVPASVIRNCVDPYPPPCEPDLLRTALGLPSGAPVLLYHGALQRWRGLDDLVEIADRLPDEWTVAIMGQGPLREAIAGRSDRIRFLEPVPHADLPHWISRATLGAVLYEGTGLNQRYCLPNKIWEFAAAGVPVVARDLPEIATVLKASGGGWLIGEKDTGDTATAMIGALTPAELDAAGIAARKFADANSWARESERFIALCHSLSAIAPAR